MKRFSVDVLHLDPAVQPSEQAVTVDVADRPGDGDGRPPTCLCVVLSLHLSTGRCHIAVAGCANDRLSVKGHTPLLGRDHYPGQPVTI